WRPSAAGRAWGRTGPARSGAPGVAVKTMGADWAWGLTWTGGHDTPSGRPSASTVTAPLKPSRRVTKSWTKADPPWRTTGQLGSVGVAWVTTGEKSGVARPMRRA